nr:hypothetical protein [Tanacetum cinerariifolium]
MRRDDNKLYKFKEGDFKRLRIQDIEDMLLLLVQGKLTNLTVEERFAFNVSLRVFTRSIVIQRRVEDLQLGFKRYQKKLNLTKPDTYHSDLKCKEAFIAYSNPRGFIYQNKDKKKRLMRIDELHKISDRTLIDVRTTLDDRAKEQEDHEELGRVCWRKAVQGRLQDATKDHMIYHMLSLSFKSLQGVYAIASGATPPKTKASVKKTKISYDTTITPLTAVGTRLSTSAKGKQPAKSSKAEGLTVHSEVTIPEAEQMMLATKRSLQQTHISQANRSGIDEGTDIIPRVPDVPIDESDTEISWKLSDEDDDDAVNNRSDDQDTDNDGDGFIHPKLSIHKEEAKDEESFDPIIQTSKNSDDEGNDDASLRLNVGSEEGHDAEDDYEELYRDININLEGSYGELDGFVSILDEGDMAFLQRKVKSGDAVRKRVLLQ